MLILLFQSICSIFLLFEEEVASKNDSFLKTEEFSSRVVCFCMRCLNKKLKELSLFKGGNAEWSVACDDGIFIFPKECRTQVRSSFFPRKKFGGGS